METVQDSRPHPPRSRRRAVEACSFCRRRKIKCDGQRPTCVNCQTYGQDCVYEPVAEVAKEAGRERHLRRRRNTSNDTGAGVRRRTRSARDKTAGSSVAEGNVPATEGSLSSIGDGDMDKGALETGVARVLVSANGVSSYHGRTSALFEDNTQERTIVAEQYPRMPDNWVERGLVAEAARQRQMEELNFRQGKLDFDGVDPDLGMHLLSLHWNRQHHSFLITYRPAFMRDMACNGPYFSKLLLNAIYFGASKFSPRLEVRKDPNDVRTAGWRYRERALLQMTNSLFALGDERSAAWLYSGLAFRMLTDLGIHVDLTSTQRFSDEDLEIRRRVFWGAFVVDKIQSLYQGRPVSLEDTDALVPIKFLDTYEELEHWQPFAYSSPTSSFLGSPAYSVSTFTCLCKLSITMSDILSCIYTERSSNQSAGELASMLDSLQVKLDKWYGSLPGHLQFDPTKSGDSAVPPPHVFSLHAMYNVLVILLHRPFVADGHLYSTSRSISVDSLMKCASAASSISSLLRAYHRAFSVRRAPYLISYATYVAATIHSRIAARRGRDSTAHANLATCLAVFKENQETNSAVRKAAIVVERLMKKHGVVVDASGALDGDPQGEQRGEQEPRGQAGRDFQRRADPSQTTASEGPVSDNQNPAATGDSGIGYSPGSDWMDIDGIIQSFLQENEGNWARSGYDAEMPSQVPEIAGAVQSHAPFMPRNDPAMITQGAMAYDSTPVDVNPADGTYDGGYPQQGFWSSGGGFVSLEDPLFGFNGSSLAFPLTGRKI
ncbi:hypothetical protein ACJZ2D_014142 [Fusarium nematophilum]